MRGILLIPVKSLTTAKQRLAAALDQARRSQLAEAMLRDVMTAAAGVLGRIDVALVTGDAPRAARWPREFGFLVIDDTRNESETAAIEMATAWCEQRGYDTTIVVPGDIPLITSDELHRVLDAAPAEGAVFVPAYDRRGSNCILRRPASIIPLRFGNDSFLPHCEAMKQDRQGTGHPGNARHRTRHRQPSRTRPAVAARRQHQRAAAAAVMGLRRRRRGAMGSSGLMPPRTSKQSANCARFRCSAFATSFAGDSVADLIVDALALGGSALSRRRHPGGQAQDRLQGGGPHGCARFGEAIRCRTKLCRARTASTRAWWSWHCARPSAWCARSTS